MRVQKLLFYIAKRVFMSCFVLMLAALIIFITVRLTPGDPVLNKIGPYGDASPENYARVSAELGLDKPYSVQYMIWIKNCLQLDFGVSLRSGISVSATIAEKLLISLELIVVSLVLATSIAIPLGMVAALKRGKIIDQIIETFSTFFLAVPAFCISLLMIIVFAVKLKVLPVGGYISFAENPVENLRALILPATTLALYETAIICRHVRSQALDVLGSNYIRTAKAKGLPYRTIYFKHALRNIAVMMLTIIGTEFASLFGSTVICEQVFGWSGLGWYIYQSIVNRDYPAVQASVLVVVVIFVLVNLIVDVLVTVIDPRVKMK